MRSSPRGSFGPALLAVLLALMLVVSGCPGSPAEEPVVCLEAGVLPSCSLPYEPTYDNLYTRVLQPSCAKGGFACHSPEGRQGGLDFFDKEGAFSALRAQRSVRPGSPECSDLIQRLSSTDGFYRMPPGANLPAEDQCALASWVRAGAER